MSVGLDYCPKCERLRGYAEDYCSCGAREEAIRSPEAEAYWRGVIAGELRHDAGVMHPSEYSTLLRDMADAIEAHGNKTQEG